MRKQKSGKGRFLGAFVLALLVVALCPLGANVAFAEETGAGEQGSATGNSGEATQLADLQSRFDASGNPTFQIGSWTKTGETSSWSAVDASAYRVVGYADKELFRHMAEKGLTSNVKWTAGLPSGDGDYVVRVDATGDDLSIVGIGYFSLDNICLDESSETYYDYNLARKDARVSYGTCGSVSSIALGWEESDSTNRVTTWSYIDASAYKVAGYATCDAVYKAGSFEDVNWISGLPKSNGDFIVKLTANTAKGNAYFGSKYVWVSLDDVEHAGAGSWIVDKKATYTSTGVAHLKCKYCGAACNTTTLAKLTGAAVGTTVTAGSGSSKAKYKIGSAHTATYVKCAAAKSATSATVPDAISVNGEKYTVTAVASKAFSGYSKLKSVNIKASSLTKISQNAFSGCKKLTTITVKSDALTKSGVKKSLSGSTMKTVKTTSQLKASYKAMFTKSNCGKKVTVK